MSGERMNRRMGLMAAFVSLFGGSLPEELEKVSTSRLGKIARRFVGGAGGPVTVRQPAVRRPKLARRVMKLDRSGNPLRTLRIENKTIQRAVWSNEKARKTPA